MGKQRGGPTIYGPKAEVHEVGGKEPGEGKNYVQHGPERERKGNDSYLERDHHIRY